MPDFLLTGPAKAKATLLLAHGAGAAMDSAWMNDLSARLDAKGVRVARFEFAYMAGRRNGERKPPPKGESLQGEYRDAVAALKLTGTTFSLQAYIGVIMLAGIVVSNAILLVDYTNVLRRRDGVHESVYRRQQLAGDSRRDEKDKLRRLAHRRNGGTL